MRLGKAVKRHSTELRTETEAVAKRLRPEYLLRSMEKYRQESLDLTARLQRAARQSLNSHRQSLESLAAGLDNLSPFAVLSRGYSITLRPDTGEVISDSKTVGLADQVTVRLHRGQLSCVVKDKLDEADPESAD